MVGKIKKQEKDEIDVKCMIPKKVCRLAYRMITQCKQNRLQTYLYGSFSCVGVSNLNVVVNRIELNKDYCQPCVSEEFVIPFELAKYDLSSGAENLFYDGAIQAIWSEFTLKPLSLNITNCIQFWAYACIGGESNHDVIKNLQDTSEENLSSKMYFSKFKVKCLVLDYLVGLTPVNKPPVISSPLVESLDTADFNLSKFNGSLDEFHNQSDVHFGMTDTGQISLQLNTDPTVLISSIGVWISGVKETCDFRIWKACLHFILTNNNQMNGLAKSDQWGCMNTPKFSPMLLAVYGCDSTAPRFYEINMEFSYDLDTCDSSVLMLFHRYFKDPIKLKFAVLSSREDRIPFPKFSSALPEYFTWNLVNSSSADECSFAVLKNSVKRFCNFIQGLKYFEDRPIHPATPTLSSAVSQMFTSSVLINQSNAVNDLHLDPSSSKIINLNLPESHIPEASLLFEEGVKISNPSYSRHIVSEQFDKESLPREPPRKCDGLIKISESFNNNFVRDDNANYDPNRYRHFLKINTSNAPALSNGESSAKDTKYTANVDLKNAFSKIHGEFDTTNKTMHFQSILTKLPLNQLERLEQIIADMLDKKKMDYLVPYPSKDSPERDVDQYYSNKCEPKQSISIGVNTTFVSSEINLKNKEHLIVTRNCAVNNQNLQSSVPTTKSFLIDDGTNILPQNNNNVNNSKREWFIPNKSNPSCILQVKSTSLLYSKAMKQAEVQKNSKRRTETSDKYSLLLENIQHVLNNRKRCDCSMSAPNSNNNNFGKELRTSNSISPISHHDNCVNEYKNPEKVNQRVSNWLQAHTYFGCNNSINQNVGVPSCVQNIHSVKVKEQDNNPPTSGRTSDTDQSIYLASLVNKYLSNKPIDNPGADTDSSIAVNYSLATLDYMKRHGIIGFDEKYEAYHYTIPPVVSSTPTANDRKPPSHLSSSIPFMSTNPKLSDLDASFTSGESLPNIINGLGLDKSTMTNICNTDMKYLSTLSACSSKKDTLILPISEVPHVFDSRPSVRNSPILDLERLRSLPKLL
ncbi:STIL centriolar assembly protein [Schistosoma japonicum]|nr:STIL centriolar assembly protein [Schistosoma japonicum]